MRVQQRIAKMLQVSDSYPLNDFISLTIPPQKYDGTLNFATDAWTSPNHKAYVAFTVHFKHEGAPTLMLLDLVEVAKSHSGVNLAEAFANVLEEFGIEYKVRFNVI